MLTIDSLVKPDGDVDNQSQEVGEEKAQLLADLGSSSQKLSAT